MNVEFEVEKDMSTLINQLTSSLLVAVAVFLVIDVFFIFQPIFHVLFFPMYSRHRSIKFLRFCMMFSHSNSTRLWLLLLHRIFLYESRVSWSCLSSLKNVLNTQWKEKRKAAEEGLRTQTHSKAIRDKISIYACVFRLWETKFMFT